MVHCVLVCSGRDTNCGVMVLPRMPIHCNAMSLRIPGEWISGAVCMYIANHLVKNYGDSDEVRP